MQTTNGQIALHLLTPNATNSVCTTIASLSYAALVKAILLSSLHNCGTQIIVIAVTCAAGQTIRDPLLGRWLLHIPMFRPTVMGLLSFSSLLLLPFQLLLLVLQSNSMMMVNLSIQTQPKYDIKTPVSSWHSLQCTGCARMQDHSWHKVVLRCLQFSRTWYLQLQAPLT